MEISIETVDNGWILTRMYGKKEVYLNKEELLLAVHRQLGNWKIGEVVRIIEEHP